MINLARKQGAPYLTDDCVIFGMVARNGTYPCRKGHDMVMDAAAQLLAAGHKDFIIYMHSLMDGGHGGPDLVKMLNAYTRAYQDERINRHVLFPPPAQMHLGPYPSGFPDQKMATLYNAMDCFVNPSQWEGFGLTSLEAAACGVPSIVTDVGCQPEVAPVGWRIPQYRRYYAPATDTFIADPDLPALVRAMESALRLAGDPAMREKAVRHAQKYDWDDIVDKQWIPLLEEIEAGIRSPKKVLVPA
jgi:glycosyltransferase involved in cell wall biosynthesis